jgi:tetratricopeptide (TPR) repeat protein
MNLGRNRHIQQQFIHEEEKEDFREDTSRSATAGQTYIWGYYFTRKGDDMKRTIVLILVAALLVFNVNPSGSAETQEKSLKVLVDESRVHSVDEEIRKAYVAEIDEILKEMEKLLKQFGLNVTLKAVCDPKYSFQNVAEPWGFGLAKTELAESAEVTVRDSGGLTYSTLMKYDVLVIASFDRKYTTAEVDAIKQFVENGGGLLLLGDIDSENNSVSQAFDVSFHQGTGCIADEKAENLADDIHTFYMDDLTSHPITKNVKKIVLKNGVPIVSHKAGQVLAATSSSSWVDLEGEGNGVKDTGEEGGPFDVLLAMENFGVGRAIFFGGAESFWNQVTAKNSENLDLFDNAVKWLGEPGGPYKQYKILNEQAQTLLGEGIELYGTQKFAEAEKTLLDAITASERSNEVYPNAESARIIEEAQAFGDLCKKGLEADEIFDSAEDLFENKEYEKAIPEYEEAGSLYTEIEYTERIDTCRTRITESNEFLALRGEAVSLFDQAEEALGQKSSMFDVTGIEEARSLFEQSKAKWEQFGDPAQVTACEEKIALCDSEIAHKGQTKMLVIVGVAAIVVVCGVMVVILMKKRKKAESQNQEGDTQKDEDT